MPKAKTKAELADQVVELRGQLAACEAQRDHMEKVQSSSTVGAVLTSLIRWGGIVGVAYFAYGVIAVLAGKETHANIGISVMTSLSESGTVKKFICTVIVVGAILWGWWQQRLRRRNIRRMGDRKAELERRIDPKRKSSQLSPSGTTNPGDQP